MSRSSFARQPFGLGIAGLDAFPVGVVGAFGFCQKLAGLDILSCCCCAFFLGMILG